MKKVQWRKSEPTIKVYDQRSMIAIYRLHSWWKSAKNQRLSGCMHCVCHNEVTSFRMVNGHAGYGELYEVSPNRTQDAMLTGKRIRYMSLGGKIYTELDRGWNND